MEVWLNQGTPEQGLFIVRFTNDEKARIERARSIFLKSDIRKNVMDKESVQIVKNSLAKFIGRNVFCYEDEHGLMQNETIVDHEAVADTRDVLILQAQSSFMERSKSTDLAAQLLAGAVNAMKEQQRSKPVESTEDLTQLILSR